MGTPMLVAAPRVEHFLTQRQAGWLAWVVVCIVWGLTYQWIATGDTWAPLLFTALRYTLAGLTVLALSPPEQRAAVLRAGSFWRLAIAGCLMFVTGNGILVWALQSSAAVQPNPGIVAVTIAMIPVYTSVFSSLKKRNRRWQPATWAGLLVGLAGVALLSPELGPPAGGAVRDMPQVPLFLPTSTALVMVALQFGCISWAAGSLCASGASRSVPPLIVAGTQMLTAGIVLLLLAFLHGDLSQAPAPPRVVVAALLSVTVVGSVIGYFCYAVALRHLSVNTVSLHAYLNPIVAMVVTVAVEKRAYRPIELVAALLVLTGVALALHTEGSRARRLSDCGAGRVVKT
jgi:drug/metabolite transporter (DMT)-like permease